MTFAPDTIHKLRAEKRILTSALEEAKRGLEEIADLWNAPDHRRRETPTMAESTLNRIKKLTEEK